ncbi:MAG TPA: TfoX/Sxy family protein [Microbacterium sp.]|nr:TfoX/Sxy family protein [Microbacterium sp.]
MTRRVHDDETRALLDRIERRLPDRPVREVSMFGAIAVMVDDSMVVAVNKDRSLLVRVDSADDEELSRRSEATRAEMGAGRSMGPGWLRISEHAIAADDALDFWIQAALLRLERSTSTEGSRRPHRGSRSATR